MAFSTLKKGKIEALATGTINELEHDIFSEWKELTINSSDRETSSQSTHNFSVLVKYPAYNVDYVVLDSIAVPPLYNIDANNQVINFTHTGAGAGTFDATITAGAYSLTSGTTTLLAAIKTAMDAAAGGGHTFTITYNDNTYKLTFTISGDAFTLNWSTNTQLARMLGFAGSDTASAGTQTSSKVVDIGIDELYIRIDEFGSSNKGNTANSLQWSFKVLLQNDTFGQKNILYRLHQLGNQNCIFDNARDINRLSVRVYDKYGQIKDFQGAEWVFTIKFRENTR